MPEIDQASKVIKFDPIRLPVVVREKGTHCSHPAILLDPGHRVVECKKCEEIIDPFDYLVEWANGDRQLNSMRKRIRAKIKRGSKILEDLKRQEYNIKARIRRLKTNQPCQPSKYPKNVIQS